MKLKANNSKELRGLIDQYRQGSYGETVIINKGIIFKKFFQTRTGKDLLHVALRMDKFKNRYLLSHSQKLIDKYLRDAGYPIEGDWNQFDGASLDIKGVGKNTQLAYREIEL